MSDDPEIVMIIQQDVHKPKNPRKSNSRSKNFNSKGGATPLVQNPASSVLPSRVHQATNTAPYPRQVPPANQSPPWWAWGPLPQPWYQNWDMWQKVSFHQSRPPTSLHDPSTFQFGSNSSVPVQRSSQTLTAMFTPLSAQQQATSTSSPRVSDSSDAEQDSPVSKQQDSSDADEILVNALDFKTTPGKAPEPLLSMHVSTSIKKKIWVGQYIDLAYLLETQLVPDDDKAYEFSCSNNNTTKLNLPTAKPNAKVDSYTSWNKAFRVLIEIVALKWLDQCLPMVSMLQSPISSII